MNHNNRYSLLLFCILMTSCGGADKTPAPNDSASATTSSPAQQTDGNLTLGDPSFVVPEDTVSTHGPRSITRNVIKDSNGTMWLATWEGIIRYDGTTFTNITLKEGARRFHVFCILEDHAGNLWFGTIGGGVFRYDGAAFTYFTTADGLANNVVECIQEDLSGNIWFGTHNGASRYDGKTFTNFTEQDGIRLDVVYSILQDKNGILWLATDGGVVQYDGQSFTKFTNQEGLPPFYRTRSIIEDRGGNIWIGSADGLCRYDPAASLKSGKKTLTHFTKGSSNVFEDNAGILWLSESQENNPDMTLTRYDGKTFTNIKSAKQIFGVTDDRAGNIWFGTERGVRRYDGKSVTDFLDERAGEK